MEKERQKEADFLDLLAALYAGRRLILGGTLALCVLAAALSFLVPEEFESTAQILPPKEQKQGFGFSDLLSALPIPTLRLGEKGTPADIFIATLKSHRVRRQMVKEFDLLRRYELETMTDAIETLGAKTTVDKTEEGTISIAVLDRDPQMAADMVARYIELLDLTNNNALRYGVPGDVLRHPEHDDGQDFAELVYDHLPDADGILYPSWFTGSRCIAIFDRGKDRLVEETTEDLTGAMVRYALRDHNIDIY